MVPRLIQICRIKWWCFYFQWEMPFFGKFGPKIQNCQFELKFGTSTNSNMENLMVVFIFSIFNQKYSFWVKFGPKNQNYQFKLKYGTETDFSMHNSLVMFIFSVFKWKYCLWANLIQRITIITLSWNLEPRLIRICRIQWGCSLFLISTRNTFFQQICSKKSKLSVKAEIWYLD